MKVVPLDQLTPSWFHWRRRGVGGSDLVVLMGHMIDPKNPVTVDDLLAEKLDRQRRASTFAMRRGLRSESPALQLLERRTGTYFRPACVEHSEQSWMHASLDGLSFLEDQIAEIKAPKIVDHEMALAGIVPHIYKPQVQWQLLVTGLDECLYVSYSTAVRFGGPDHPSLAIVPVDPDAELQVELLDVASRFWQRVCDRAGTPAWKV